MYLFYVGSDTLVTHSIKLIRALINKGHDVKIITPLLDVENASKSITRNYPELTSRTISILEAIRLKPKHFVCCNDWSPEARFLIHYMRKSECKIIALQESVVDLSSRSDKYTYSDIVFCQGNISSNAIKNHTVIVGNLRYNQTQKHHINNNNKTQAALINCNFTYGIYEDWAQIWINEVTKALHLNDSNFKISKHPRDTTDLSLFSNQVIQSGVMGIEEQIESSQFVITRFSSLIHESILKHKPVIYYNPMYEDMGYPFNPDEKVLFICRNSDELIQTIKKIKSNNYEVEDFNDYINPHLLFNSEKSVVQLIIDHIESGSDIPNNEKNLGSIYINYTKQIIKRIMIKLKNYGK